MRHPRVYYIRIATVMAVETLLDRGKYPTQRQALEYVMLQASKKRLHTGFEHHTTFARAWAAFRTFRCRNRQELSKNTDGS